MKFSLDITHVTESIEETENTTVVSAYGSAALVSYAFNDVKEELTGATGAKFAVDLRDDNDNVIAALTADGGTLVDVLKARLARVRKDAKPAGE